MRNARAFQTARRRAASVEWGGGMRDARVQPRICTGPAAHLRQSGPRGGCTCRAFAFRTHRRRFANRFRSIELGSIKCYTLRARTGGLWPAVAGRGLPIGTFTRVRRCLRLAAERAVGRDVRERPRGEQLSENAHATSSNSLKFTKIHQHFKTFD